ncbi:magnesium transporter NIPA-domain-containing protein [Trametes elegans]|nr:magnesium transporter NIPA-domain-containing protein [Trametes elegans]
MHIPGANLSALGILDGDNLPRITPLAAAGIGVAISGNILISLALNCQKLAHKRLEREREAAAQELRRPKPIRSTSAPTRAPERPLETLSTTHSTPIAAVAIFETDPLLEESADDASSDITPLPSPRPARRWLFSHHNPARNADRSHLASTHALMPVDILPVHTDELVEHADHTQKEESPSGNESDYLKSKLWWLGFLLMNVGELGNFISYAFAPASVVAPLGTFALIANCIFAPLMLGERFRKRDFLGIIIAIVGAVTVVLSANPSDTRLDPENLIKAITQRPFEVYAIVYIVGISVLSGLSEGPAGKRWVYIDVGLCALFGGFTVLATKAVSTLLTLEWFEIFKEWITYPVIAVLILTGVGQIRYLNRALMRFDSKIVVPTQFVMFNLSAIVGSALLYGDFKDATFHQLITFLYGCGATFAGVFIIAWAPSAPAQEPEDDERTLSGSRGDAPGPGPGSENGATGLRTPKLGSLARRSRPTLIVPDSLSAPGTPILHSRQSIVSLYGFSPAQRVLLINHSPRDEFVRPNLQDPERGAMTPPLPESLGRRRAVSWLGGEYGRQLSRASFQRYGATSTTTSREHSQMGDRVRSHSRCRSRSRSLSPSSSRGG